MATSLSVVPIRSFDFSIPNDSFNYYIGYRSDGTIGVANSAREVELWASSVNQAWSYVMSQLSVVMGSKLLLFGDGVFEVTQRLEPISNLWVKGKSQTVLRVKASFPCTVFHATHISNFNVSDLAIDGNKWNVLSPDLRNDKRDNAFYYNDVNGFVIERVHVYDTLMHGLYIHANNRNGDIRNSVIERAGRTGSGREGTGLYNGQGNILLSACYTVSVENNTLKDGYSKQLYFGYGAHDNTVRNNTFKGAAVAIFGDANNNRNNIIENNAMSCRGGGVWLYGYPEKPICNITIRGNSIIGKFGVWYNRANKEGVIEGNAIEANEYGIRFVDVTNTETKNNIVVAGATYHSIESLGASDYLVIHDNVVNRPISLVGSHNQVYNNTGCQPTKYTLTVTTTEGGTANPLGTLSYPEGSTVKATATPNIDYTFDHWDLDGANVGNANPYAVVMGGNHVLHCVFAYTPPKKTVQFSVTSNSTVNNLSFKDGVIDLKVAGQLGTTSFVDIEIAKTISINIANLQVYLNGTRIGYTVSDSEDSWTIHIEYTLK